MSARRLRLPHWTSHPGFGVAALLLTGVLLVIHGEPQPSSHPSGTSIVVNDTNAAPAPAQAALVVSAGRVQWRQGSSVKDVALPKGLQPTEVLTAHGAAVLLGQREQRQRAYLVRKDLSLLDLGPADGVIPAAADGAAMVIETAVGRAGEIGAARAKPTATASPTSTSRSTSSAEPGPRPVLPDFIARRFDEAGRAVGSPVALPVGTRLAVDTGVGMVVWRPEQPIFDNGVPLEPRSAAAMLVRPDLTTRQLGPVHPLAASRDNLLVWDVVQRRFGLMPLRWVDSTATSTDEPVSSNSPPSTASTSASASASPTHVAGTAWFDRTRGIVVTGPAAFNADGSAFAVYAQVGSRRRLVVARTAEAELDVAEVAVLALAQPSATRESASSSTPTGPTVSGHTSTTESPSPSDTPTQPLFGEDGFPFMAPLTPTWWSGRVIGVGTDGAVFGYVPGTSDAQLVDLGGADVASLCSAP